jgi:hypothetical protein
MGPFKYSNRKKPSSKKWKNVSKFLARSLPAYIGCVAIAPNNILDADGKLLATFLLSLAVATISGLSEFTTDEVKDEVTGYTN